MSAFLLWFFLPVLSFLPRLWWTPLAISFLLALSGGLGYLFHYPAALFPAEDADPRESVFAPASTAAPSLTFVRNLPLERVLYRPFEGLPSVPAYDREVFYTDAGYVPDRLELLRGQNVAFRNISDLPMWTASDPHPVHSDFSPFDSRRALARGETYEFRFTAAGTYGWHNHSKSDHRGIARVTDPVDPAPNIDKTKESRRAQRDALLAMLDHHDPSSIFAVIDTIEADGALSRDCHDMAHDIGHRAYETFGFSTAMTFNAPDRASHTSVDDVCAGGYMHGILEELFLHRPELQYAPESVCAGIPDRHRGSCFHGVGHGLMFTHRRDVPASLASCRTLSVATDTYRCFEGVWMEFFWGNTEHAGANSLGWSLDKPLAPCQNAESDEKPTCFLYAHLGYLRSHPRDYDGVVRFCTAAGLSEGDAEFCLKGIGITMMKHFTSKGLERTEAIVAGLSDARKRAYYAGVLGYSLLSGVPRADLATFCGRLVSDGNLCSAELVTARE